ncbi:hypothetical protein MHYP_G00165530 [Metynnis hypsauchen]
MPLSSLLLCSLWPSLPHPELAEEKFCSPRSSNYTEKFQQVLKKSRGWRSAEDVREQGEAVSGVAGNLQTVGQTVLRVCSAC